MKDFENKLRSSAESLKDSMQIPNDTIEMLNEKGLLFMSKKSNKIIKRVGLSVAGIAAAFVLVVNCVPSIAYASRDIPVVSQIVRVVTFGRFEVNEYHYVAKVETPQIEGVLNKELEDKLNREFKEHSLAVIAAFEQDVKELEAEYGKDFHLGVEASYLVRTDNDDVLAIDTYIVNTAASSSTRHSFYNINKKTGELIALVDLFKADADYVTPISDYIISEMEKQNAEGEVYWIGSDGDFEGFEKIKQDQNFYINDSGNIVISFDKYEVAIGAMGCPEFEIPDKVVKDILK